MVPDSSVAEELYWRAQSLFYSGGLKFVNWLILRPMKRNQSSRRSGAGWERGQCHFPFQWKRGFPSSEQAPTTCAAFEGSGTLCPFLSFAKPSSCISTLLSLFFFWKFKVRRVGSVIKVEKRVEEDNLVLFFLPQAEGSPGIADLLKTREHGSRGHCHIPIIALLSGPTSWH